jgi:methyl-accepting chemotaxis protein
MKTTPKSTALKAATPVAATKENKMDALLERIEELERLNNRNIMALEEAVDAVIQIDSNKDITFYNKAAERMFGYRKAEVMGQNVKMIVPQEHRAGHDEYIDANIRTNVNKVVGLGRDLEMSRKDGSKFWGNLSLSKVETEEGVTYTAFVKDITVQREAVTSQEQLQRELETRMDQINVACVVSESDLKGNIIYVNDLLCEVSGYSREECIGQPHSMFRHPDMPKETFKELWATIGKGKIFRGVIKNRCKDGSPYWVDAIIAPVMGPNGKPIKYIGVRYVITEQVLKEEELRLAAEEQKEVIDVIRGIAVGDLSQRVQRDTDIAQEVNSALENLTNVLLKISQGAEFVTGAASNMLERSESIKNNSNEVATAISQMAKGAQDQALRTDESSKLVDAVMQTANQMQEKANIINKAAELGQKGSESGLKIIKNLVENMEGISSSAGKTAQSIEVLTQRAEEIARTLNVITDIAAQTNLLALNAAIEAARAGDAGRGFAVVAEEIRKLAEDSRRSAVDIEKIIGDVQKDTNQAGRAIETMETSVKQGNGATKEAETIFMEIAQSSQDTFSYSKEIQDATTQQKASIETVVKNIEQIVVVAEETAAGTQQVASSSQELNASMTEVATASTQLSGIAADLKSSVSQFKLKNN